MKKIIEMTTEWLQGKHSTILIRIEEVHVKIS